MKVSTHVIPRHTIPWRQKPFISKSKERLKVLSIKQICVSF